jgi:aminopeptidase
MTDPRIEKLADLLVNYSVAVRPGDKVVITGGTIAEPLLKAIYTRVLLAGGYPTMMAGLPGLDEILFRNASDDQLQHVPGWQKDIISSYDVRISIGAEHNTKALTGVDPTKMVTYSQAHRELMEIALRRSAAKELRWTVALFPTDAYAQDAEMSLSEYEDFVYNACLPDADDPVAYWQRFSGWQQKIVDWLKEKKTVRVTGPDTDLRLNIAGRTFENCDGRYNMPDGEVFTGPVEDSIDGKVRFSYPAIYEGHEVTGVRLRFEEGKVVDAAADKNEEFLLKIIDTDEGSRRVGEFAIGTNEGITRFTRQILFDEKINGSFHMALGIGYPETGSRNKSAIHWDLICDLRDGGEIWVDDELIYRNGKFVIDF